MDDPLKTKPTIITFFNNSVWTVANHVIIELYHLATKIPKFKSINETIFNYNII